VNESVPRRGRNPVCFSAGSAGIVFIIEQSFAFVGLTQSGHIFPENLHDRMQRGPSVFKTDLAAGKRAAERQYPGYGSLAGLEGGDDPVADRGEPAAAVKRYPDLQRRVAKRFIGVQRIARLGALVRANHPENERGE
jgi:hypothetical protein